MTPAGSQCTYSTARIFMTASHSRFKSHSWKRYLVWHHRALGSHQSHPVHQILPVDCRTSTFCYLPGCLRCCFLRFQRCLSARFAEHKNQFSFEVAPFFLYFRQWSNLNPSRRQNLCIFLTKCYQASLLTL